MTNPASAESWRAEDPKLRLQRIRLWNFRRIASIDVTVPATAQFVCLVGPNGSGKSALLSLLIDALRQTTIETGPDFKPGPSDDASHGRTWSTQEIRSGERAMGLRFDWTSAKDSWSHTAVVSHGAIRSEANLDDVAAIERFLELPQNSVQQQRGLAAWQWIQYPHILSPELDLVSRIVLLDRPASRFEVPSYEERDRAFSPSSQMSWEGRRLLPIRVQSGLSALEAFLLDLVLDAQLSGSSGDGAAALDKFSAAVETLSGQPQRFVIPPWPFRRVGIGPVRTLSMLSAGELDVVVTVGAILAQQTYLLRKFPRADSSMPSGIVFVDEIDSHLHPSWQEIVLPLLGRLFPTVQFILTTHSPFLLRSLPRDKAVVLRLPDGAVFEQDFAAWSADDILKAVFRTDPEWSKEIDEQLKILTGLIFNPDEADRAVELYLSLSNRSAPLRAACDRIVARGEMTLRDRIRSAATSANEKDQ